MYPQWPPMQPNEKQRQKITQQSLNQGFFQFQQNFPYMGQQFMFPNFPPFPNNVNVDGRRININSSGQYQWQSGNSQRGENNKISYERNPNQEQYASYPPGAIYRHASGPGWQQQETFYPANSFK